MNMSHVIYRIFIIGFLFLGCLNPFAPRLTQSIEDVDFIVTEQQNPDEVLQNFKVSYIFRDSLLYSDLLDSNFIFTYYDPEIGTSGQNVTWTRDTELRTTGRLFRFFDVIDLIWHSSIYEIEGKESKVEKAFDLTLVSSESNYHITGRAEFTFKECWDGKWRITQWIEESNL